MTAQSESFPLWRQILFGRRFSRTLIRAVILAAILLAVSQWVLMPKRVTHVSMEPAYEQGRIVLVNRLAYLRGEPRRGDVVAIQTSGPSVLYLKRIVGLPGEEVALREGRVLIDGSPLEEPYVKSERRPWDVTARNLGTDEYFVIGDNRTMSREAHDFGAIQRERIVGSVWP